MTIGPFGSNLVADDYRTEGVPVVFVRDVREDGFSWISRVYVAIGKARELASHNVRPGDVVATKMGLPPAVAAVYPSTMPSGIVTADIIRLRPDLARVRSEWFATYLNSLPVRSQVAAITGGVTRPKITLHDFRNVQVAVPTLGEQDRLLAALEGVNERERRERHSLAKLLLLKQGLMDDLLTGRVRIQEAEEALA